MLLPLCNHLFLTSSPPKSFSCGTPSHILHSPIFLAIRTPPNHLPPGGNCGCALLPPGFLYLVYVDRPLAFLPDCVTLYSFIVDRLFRFCSGLGYQGLGSFICILLYGKRYILRILFWWECPCKSMVWISPVTWLMISIDKVAANIKIIQRQLNISSPHH